MIYLQTSTIQDVDQTSIKYISHDNTGSNGDVDGHFCPGSRGGTHPHQKLYDQKLKSARETRKLETEGKNGKKK